MVVSVEKADHAFLDGVLPQRRDDAQALDCAVDERRKRLAYLLAIEIAVNN